MTYFAEKLKSAIPAISILLSIIVAWWIVPPVTGFPMVPVSFFFVSLVILVYLVRNEKTWFDTMLYVGVLLLSGFTIFRANGFLQFFDIIFILFFGSLLISPILKEYGLIRLVLSPLIVIRDTVASNTIFPYIFKIPKKTAPTNIIREYIPTIVITALVLLVTIPLLASANPIFNSLLQQVLRFLNLNWLFNFLFADTVVVYVFRFIFFAILIYCIPRVLTIAAQEPKEYASKQWFSINFLYPKIAMAFLLILFFITQVQLYFASPEALRSFGYTNSRLTNEVFFQVTIVAFIVLLLTYFDKGRKRWNTILTYLLAVEAFFLIGIAFKSVFEYSTHNGFTQKRLWGYTSMTWLTGVFIAFLFYYKKQIAHIRFIKQVLTYTMLLVLLVNYLNFDYLIYHVSKPTVAGQIDYSYISDLSADGRYNREVLEIAMKEAQGSQFQNQQKNNIVYAILGNIDRLKYKYGLRKDINTFNYSEYKEYVNVKNINTEDYRQKIKTPQQDNTPKI
jgi:hypothetical protein